jgi:hypothetical protein
MAMDWQDIAHMNQTLIATRQNTLPFILNANLLPRSNFCFLSGRESLDWHLEETAEIRNIC